MKFLLIVLTTHLIGGLIARSTKDTMKQDTKHADKNGSFVQQQQSTQKKWRKVSQKDRTNSGAVRPLIHPAEHALR